VQDFKEFAQARAALPSALSDLERVRGADHLMTLPMRQARQALPKT